MTSKTYIVRLDVSNEAEPIVSPALIAWLFKSMSIAYRADVQEVIESHKVYDGLWGEEPF